MRGIEIKKDIIHYYGNLAGYLKDGIAIVDPIFKGEELEAFLAKNKLEANWTTGVYDKLSNGIQISEDGERLMLKACRIWQLKKAVNPLMKFIGYEELLNEGFGEPSSENYDVVFDGEIETNELEEIYAKFNMQNTPEFKGHSLSMSDVVELYDQSGSEYHYVDCIGFKEISFEKDNQKLIQTM